MSDEQNITTFRVEFLTGETVGMGYEPEEAESLRDLLDRATTILGCPECGDLVPVTGGIPRAMPTCPVCGDPLHGVTRVIELEEESDE